MLFFEISELELMVAGRPRGILRGGGGFKVLSGPVHCYNMIKQKQSECVFLLFEVHITLGFQSEVSAFILFMRITLTHQNR